MSNKVFLRPSYCTTSEYETVTGRTASADSVTLAKLKQASDIIDYHVNVAFKVDSSGNPTNVDVHDILKESTAYQMEYMVELGLEDFDKLELTGQVQLGSLKLDKYPDILAPRAKRLLVNHGFLGHTAAVFYNYDDSLPKAITDDQTFE
tara:strand:- start:5931 stop:6377 length:447 start_codon:yes stop_codon:yes gene_type:complete